MRFFLTFLTLFIFWIILSGKFDAFHLALGLFSTLLVTLWTGDFIFQDADKSFGYWFGEFFRLVVYNIWLFFQIVLANFHVIYVSLHPNMEKLINPKMVSFKSGLKGEFAQYVLANSITLTPGTVTVEVEKGTFKVHALTDQTAEGVPGTMLAKVARVFGESN